MPAGLNAADRKLLWGAGGVTILMLAATAALAPPAAEQGEVVPSSYSSASGGALAAYLLLSDLRYPVRRWEEPPGELPEPGRGALLILAEPTQMPSNGESEALRRFLRSGGRILFCGASIKSFFPAAGSSSTSESAWKEFSANFPSGFSRGADRIAMRPQAYWPEISSSQLALYGDKEHGFSPAREGGDPHSVVVSWRFGEGQLLWWAGATPLTNAGIREAGNLKLFLNSVAPPSDDTLSIYWDEYFHGERGALWSYVAGTPVAWGIVQIGLIALAVLFTFSRRSGPIAAPAAVSRLSPLEFVETMGGLYQRAGAASIAVEVSYRRVRLELSRRLGLPAAVSDPELAQAAAERLGFSKTDFAGSLERAAGALLDPKLSWRLGLRAIQDLERWLPPAKPGAVR
jgi:Domain of unknown function (DUF4350)